MTVNHCYLTVEGQQDVFFVGRILQELGHQTVMDVEEIPERWEPLINGERRVEHDARLSRGKSGLQIHEMFPGFCFASDSHSIVVQGVRGNLRQFRRKLEGVNALLDGGLLSLDAVGVLPDADDTPDQVVQSSLQTLEVVGLPQPNANGAVHEGPPRTGVFVLPGGGDAGGLEQLLIACAESVYPDLLLGARGFVSNVDVESGTYTPEDMQEMRTPQGPDKAVVGCVASVLKPGSTVQVSILRDRWVSAASMEAPRVSQLVQFLMQLCGLS